MNYMVSIIALEHTYQGQRTILLFFGLFLAFLKKLKPKKTQTKGVFKKLKLKFQEKLKHLAIEVANIG